MRETLDIIKRVLKSKKIREINEIIPESFYEKSSLVLIVLLLFMFPHEVYVRYTHHRMSDMITYFNIIGKIILFFAIITLIIRVSGLGREGMKQYFRTHIYDLFFIIFLILTTISTLCSEDIKTAIYGAWYRNCGLISYYIFFAIYVLGRYVKKDEKTRAIIYFTFIFICSVQNLLVVAYYTGATSMGKHKIGTYELLEGTFYNINHSAYFMMMCILACMGFVMVVKSTILKICGLIMFIFNLYILILNNSFGPFLALMIGIVFLTVLYAIKHKKLSAEIIVLLLTFAVVCGVADYQTGKLSRNLKMTSDDTKMLADAENEENFENIGNGRMGLWIDTIYVIGKNPVFGKGPDNLYSLQPHNEILQFAAEMGIPAMFCYVGALIAICIQSLRKLKKSADILIIDGGVVFGYIVSSMFGVVMYYTFPFYLFFMGMLCGCEKDNVNTKV